MKINMAGQYRTASNHMGEVAAIKGKFALGWVEKNNKFEPTCWNANDGTVWTGGCGDNLVDLWPAPSAPPFRIEKPGFYRARDNRRVEVVAVRDRYAVGFDNTCALTWLVDGRHWNWASGTDGSSRTLDLVAEWREQRSQTVMFALVERQGGPEVVWSRNIGLSKVLAIRTVTITEGEGMPEKEQPDDRPGT